ncbi:MAG: ATP-binding protein [Acutalibacteraceae bacterium]
MEQAGKEITQEEKEFWWMINGKLNEEEYKTYITSPLEEQQKEKMWERSGIEKIYFKEDLQTYVPKTQSQEEAKNLIERLIGGEIKNLVFCGSNGVGKSHLAVSAVKALGGKLTTIFKIGLEIRTSFESKGKTEADILGEYAKLPFLCIDELGRSKGGEADMNYLSYIVDQRNSRGLRTMFCTNLHQSKNCPEGGKCKKCLRSYLSTDVMSRLNEKGKVFTIQGEDYRKLY